MLLGPPRVGNSIRPGTKRCEMTTRCDVMPKIVGAALVILGSSASDRHGPPFPHGLTTAGRRRPHDIARRSPGWSQLQGGRSYVTTPGRIRSRRAAAELVAWRSRRGPPPLRDAELCMRFHREATGEA